MQVPAERSSRGRPRLDLTMTPRGDVQPQRRLESHPPLHARIGGPSTDLYGLDDRVAEARRPARRADRHGPAPRTRRPGPAVHRHAPGARRAMGDRLAGDQRGRAATAAQTPWSVAGAAPRLVEPRVPPRACTACADRRQRAAGTSRGSGSGRRAPYAFQPMGTYAAPRPRSRRRAAREAEPDGDALVGVGPASLLLGDHVAHAVDDPLPVDLGDRLDDVGVLAEHQVDVRRRGQPPRQRDLLGVGQRGRTRRRQCTCDQRRRRRPPRARRGPGRAGCRRPTSRPTTGGPRAAGSR